MAILSQYPHFYQDKEGKSHRNMLQVEGEDPTMQGEYPKDGHVMIRIQDEQSQKAFKMTPQEAMKLGNEIADIAKDMMKGKRDLWKSKARP